MRTMLAGLLAPVVLLACATSPRVDTDFDPGFAFSALRSYAWLPDPPAHTDHVRLHNDLIDARVRAAVDREIRARGFALSDPSRADFLVTYYLGLETRFHVQTVTSSVGYRRSGWHNHHRTETRVREREHGTLMIDVLDPQRTLVWRGSTSSRVRRSSTPEQRTELVDSAVRAVLDEFPP